MTTFKKLNKKALALALSVLMLLACIPIAAPITAQAATAGTYYYRVTWSVDSSNNLDKTYKGEGQDNNDSCGFSIYYCPVNLDMTNDANWIEIPHDISDTLDANPSGNQVVTGSCAGMPTKIYGEADDNAAAWYESAYQVTKIEIGPSMTELKTVWEGKGYVNSSNQKHYFWLHFDGSSGGDDNSYGYINTTYLDWAAATPATITGLQDITVNIPTAGTSTLTSTAVIKDSYGVNWYTAPVYSLTTSAGRPVSNVSFTTSGDSAKLEATLSSLTTENGYDPTTGEAALTLKASITGTAITQTCTVTLKSPTYTVTFYDGDSGVISTPTCYYGGSVEAPATATKTATNAQHFVFSGWNDTSLTNITSSKSVYATFTPVSHQFVKVTKDDANHTVTCYDCGYSYDEAHTITSVTTQPTCDKAGETVYSCSACNYSRSETIPAKGHNFGGSIVMKEDGENGSHYYKCLNTGCTACGVGTVADDSVAHRWDAGTVTKHPTCDTRGEIRHTCVDGCGATYIEFTPANGHTMTKVDAVESTCTVNGNYEYYVCDVCGKMYFDEEGTIPATNVEIVMPLKEHTWEFVSRTEPTCHSAGSERYECTVCHAIDVRAIPIDETQHVFDAQVVDTKYIHTNASCGVDAVYYTSCSICGKSSKGYDGEGTFTVPGTSLEHEYVFSKLEASCNSEGTATYTCIHCGDSYQETIPPTGEHIYGDWTSVKAATCSQPGVEERSCVSCGHTETREVERIPHLYDVDDNFNCSDGGTQTFTCKVCGYSETVEIAPGTAHKYGEWLFVQAPGCNTPGVEQRECSVCRHIERRYTAPDGHVDGDDDGVCDICGKTSDEIAQETPYDPENPEASLPDSGSGSGGTGTGGSGSGDSSGEDDEHRWPDGSFKCSYCEKYEQVKDLAVTGIFYRIIHFIVHTFELLFFI